MTSLIMTEYNLYITEHRELAAILLSNLVRSLRVVKNGCCTFTPVGRPYSRPSHQRILPPAIYHPKYFIVPPASVYALSQRLTCLAILSSIVAHTWKRKLILISSLHTKQNSLLNFVFSDIKETITSPLFCLKNMSCWSRTRLLGDHLVEYELVNHMIGWKQQVC